MIVLGIPDQATPKFSFKFTEDGKSRTMRSRPGTAPPTKKLAKRAEASVGD